MVTDDELRAAWKNLKRNDPVKYVVDSSGRGTHKTIEAAIADAQKSPQRTTYVAIRPRITLENFNAE